MNILNDEWQDYKLLYTELLKRYNNLSNECNSLQEDYYSRCNNVNYLVDSLEASEKKFKDKCYDYYSLNKLFKAKCDDYDSLNKSYKNKCIEYDSLQKSYTSKCIECSNMNKYYWGKCKEYDSLSEDHRILKLSCDNLSNKYGRAILVIFVLLFVVFPIGAALSYIK
jgi:hypothetical protein